MQRYCLERQVIPIHIIVAGLNYKTAPVEIREKFAVADSEFSKAVMKLKNTNSILECVIVATCNRTELYAVVDRPQICGHYLRNFIESWFGVPREQFNKHIYVYEYDKAIDHLFRVTSGLDSMVIGETQILGQIKDSFLLAQKLGATGTIFNTLFKQAVTMAKRAHSETGIGENPVSVSYAAVELGKRIFGTYENKTIMLIGAGKMSELSAKHLHSNGAAKVIVMNRTVQRAQELADKFNGIACGMDEMSRYLPEVDVIISSTGAEGLVLTQQMLQPVLQKRKSKPMFLIDIAVPRDLDPAISDLPNVFLYDIDDLQLIVNHNLEERRREALKIEEMIKEEMASFHHWMKTQAVGPVIQALQTKASSIHETTLDNLMNRLPNLNEQERKLIRKLTKSMMNQLLRDPIVKVKEMSAGRDGKQALQMFEEIFALGETIAELKESEQSAAMNSRAIDDTEARRKEEKVATLRTSAEALI